MAFARCVDNLVEAGMVVSDLPMPGQIDIIQRPGVLESGTRCLGTDGGCVIGARIERRVEIDQINAGLIDPPHHIQIIAGEQCPVRQIEHETPPQAMQVSGSINILRLTK